MVRTVYFIDRRRANGVRAWDLCIPGDGKGVAEYLLTVWDKSSVRAAAEERDYSS
ncbi:hypothetical protein [Paenibacillus sp.]|uniref:hypothetical protein n=1 Tax=Paenibacillus sp. TaxID=58172 RepID=UPI0028239305|nr:hypothetical protein [Paenibacillus sp.]MDR0268047.1 hypothetical protein [Paenibacillus sp.]